MHQVQSKYFQQAEVQKRNQPENIFKLTIQYLRLPTVTYFYGHFLSSIATPPNSIFRFKRVLTGTAIIF